MNARPVRVAARLVSILPAACALFFAAALLALSALPFERVQAAIDALSPNGHADSFTPALFFSVTRKLRIGAIGLLLATPFLFVFGGRWVAIMWAWLGDGCRYTARLLERGGAVLRSESAGHVTVLVGICAAGALLRVLAIGQPVAYDEAFTYITYVRRPLWVALSDYSYPNNHLFHTVLAQVSTRIFGSAPWALRLPALIAGCLLMPLAYGVTRQMWGRTPALVATALVATSEALIAFSVLARGYSLLCVFFLVALVCVRDIALRGERRAWPLLVVAASLGFYTVPTFVYAYAAVAIVLLRQAARDPVRRPALIRDVVVGSGAIGVVVLCLYAPPLLVTGLSSGASLGYGANSAVDTFPSLVVRFIGSVWNDDVRGMNGAVAGTLLGAVVIALLFARDRLATSLLAAVGFVAFAATAGQRIVMPARIWLFALPLILCFCAAGLVASVEWLGRLGRWGGVAVQRVAVAVTVVPLCLYAWVVRPSQYAEVYDDPVEIAMTRDVEQVTMYLKGQLRPSDAVVAVFPTVDLLEYYFRVHDVPVGPLRTGSPQADRLLLVANDAIGLTAAGVLAKAAIPPDRVLSVTPLARFDYDVVYDVRVDPLRRRPSGP